VLSMLALGVVMGMRHALDADHIAAVATLISSREPPRRTIARGAAWGIGHTLTLFAVGGACLAFDLIISTELGRWFERIAGLMLVIMAGDVLRRWRRGRVHVHVHAHADGTQHIHVHRHAGGEAHDPARHHHAHTSSSSARALLVGMVHGVAGSAALLLLTLQLVQSVAQGLLYIAVFGAGSIAGMAALSAAVTVPLRWSRRLLPASHAVLEIGVAVAAGVMGMWMLLESHLW
jgi:hypothetical protein